VSVYVDRAVHRRRHGKKYYCHMTADSVDELHAMARRLGVKRHWYHVSRGGIPHYDLNEVQRMEAIACGAVPVDRSQWRELKASWREFVA